MAAETKPAIALGHDITICGTVYRVHCDCKDVRDQLERFFRQQALAYVDKMFADKDISQAEYSLRRKETFDQIKAGTYAYGSDEFMELRICRDSGIKQELFERIKIEKPPTLPTFDEIESWMKENRVNNEDGTPGGPWSGALYVMMVADGFAPKS